MHRDMPHQKHKQQRAQQMPPKRHQHPPAARQRPSLDQELYAASCKARTTNPAPIYAADCRAKAALPTRRPNPQRPNLKRPFYAASRKARTTNPLWIYAAPHTAPTPHAVTARAGTTTPAIPQGPKLGRQLYAAACMAGATTSARRPSPHPPNLRRHPYAASRKVDAIAPLYAAPCNRVPASRTYQG